MFNDGSGVVSYLRKNQIREILKLLSLPLKGVKYMVEIMAG